TKNRATLSLAYFPYKFVGIIDYIPNIQSNVF
ncbi:MAG: hypothetical protein EZS28_032755, partial [Streblomastix strix]